MESSSSSSFSGSSKRAKAPGHIIQVAHCLVDGCNADLSLCKDYHRRHKVCEVHSKEAKVTIAGREQRFCQQCSRFHSPVEFDEGKRSCRKRLDDHNRRRRKPQPDTMSRNSGLVLSSQQGGRLVSFSSPQILPSAIVSSSWVGAVKSENNMVLYNNQQNSLAECSSHSYRGLNQFQFIQNSNHAASASQPLLDPSNSNQKTGFNNQVVDSDRALSLLSSTPTVTTEFGLNHVLRPEFVSQARASLVHNMHYSGLVEYPYAQESKPVVSARDSDSSTLHFQEMLQHDHEGSPTSGSHQTLTFMWE